MCRWEKLKSLAVERRACLEEALQRANKFHANWKKESDWLTDAERRAYADWTPRGLPETCEVEIREHEVLSYNMSCCLHNSTTLSKRTD